MKTFNREPAALIAFIQAALITAVSFGWLEWAGINDTASALVFVAVLNAAAAVFLAYKTSKTLLAPVIELFKTLAAVFALYGLNLSSEQSGAIVALITLALGLFQRSQVEPLEKGNFNK